MAGNDINDNEIIVHIYKESAQLIRHYSNLRFVILTVFITINSVFFITYTKYQVDDFNLQKFIAFLGIIVTLIFAAFEYSVNKNVTRYYEYGDEIFNNFDFKIKKIKGFPEKDKSIIILVEGALVVLYMSVLMIWIGLFCYQLNIKDIHSVQATNCVGKVKNKPNEQSYFIFFEVGKSDIQSTQIQTIYEVLAERECFKNYHIEINGYTDTQGSPGNNKKLAINRAEKVKDYLVRSGILTDKIKFFTKEEIDRPRPITTEYNISEKLNRRVEIRIISQLDSEKKTETEEKSPKTKKSKGDN